ncbi:MAG: tol-pal system protein YbgF [Burkholderiales bacterium]|nr:tol-pal system protein YbgF [Burkholderiales bacterium]
MHRLAAALACLALALPVPAAAQLFGGDEAFQKEVRARLDKLEANAAERRLLIDLANQIELMRSDVARMRGEVEVLVHRIDSLEKRQKDLYLDIDTRLRKLEPAVPGGAPGGDAQATPSETKAYEEALNQFKLGKYETSIAAFEGFLKAYPTSPLAPSAQYWIGNSHFAKRDYKSALAAQEKVLAGWPDNPKAADAMLNIASSQEALGDRRGAQQTLTNLIQRYPASTAAASAKQRLERNARR